MAFFGAFTNAFIECALTAAGAGWIFEDPRVGGKPGNLRLPENMTWIVRELEKVFATRPGDGQRDGPGGRDARPAYRLVADPGQRTRARRQLVAGDYPVGAAVVRGGVFGTIIAGPYVGSLLVGLGAGVIKIERPPLDDEFRVAHGGRGGSSFEVYNRD